MAEVLLGLGSNLGDKAANIQEALRRIQDCGSIVAISSLWRTEPVGFVDQDWFLNAAAALDTTLEPFAVLEKLLAIEQAMGRVRARKNGPRLIDLDILLWGDLVLDEADLQIPHPRMHERLFVLAPLHEIRPRAIHPVLQLTVQALYHRKSSEGGVVLFGPLPCTPC